MLAILVLFILWIHSFFGDFDSSGIHHKGGFINILSAIIIVLIVIGFLS